MIVFLIRETSAAGQYITLKSRTRVYGNSVLCPSVKFIEPNRLFFIVREESDCWDKMELYANIERPVYDHTICDVYGRLQRLDLGGNDFHWYIYKTELDLHVKQWVYFRLEAKHKHGNVTIIHGKAPMKTKIGSKW